MSAPRCLITGVTLFHEDERWGKPADLFTFSNSFIVNASGNGESRVPRQDELVIKFSEADHYFERRNVYVFPAFSSFLNEAAKAYIQKAPHASRFSSGR